MIADVLNPKLSNADLWARYKTLRAFAENVIGPAFKECMTKSTKEIPSGKQLCDILYDILAKCWEHKKEVRINHLVKSRAAAQAKAAAANKAVDETKYRSSTDTNEMPENWMPPEFGPWLLWGDLADDRHPNFCLNVADAAEGASVGSNTSLVSVLDQPSTVTTGSMENILAEGRERKSWRRSSNFTLRTRNRIKELKICCRYT